MITEIAGITVVDTLYIQLLYACQFRCDHCFHGDRLSWREGYSLDEAVDLVEIMRRDYKTIAVCLLGGEPFLYGELDKLLQHIKAVGMRTEICTNGYRIRRKMTESGHLIDLLRISIEGMEEANDAIRHPGSFVQAMGAFARARELGIATGATMTVTATNIRDVVPLALRLQDLGVGELKLHHLRPVGYASAHPELIVADRSAYVELRDQLAGVDLQIRVVADEQLLETPPQPQKPYFGRAPRIEADPRGFLTLSCNGVGADAYALVYDKEKRLIRGASNAQNELALEVPPVVYADV